MAETITLKNKKTGKTVTLRRKTTQPSIVQRAAEGRARVEQDLPTRMDLMGRGISNIQKMDPLSMGVGGAQMAMGIPQRGLAGVAGHLGAFQDWQKNVGEQGFLKGSSQTHQESVKGLWEGLSGQKSHQLGDIYQRAGVSPLKSSAAGLGTALLFGGLGAKKAGIKPTVHTDKIVTGAGKNIVSKIESGIAGLRNSYRKVSEPFFARQVSSDTFEGVIRQIPKRLQNEARKLYGNQIVDKSGRQGSTVKGLFELRLYVDDLIKQSKEPASRLSQHAKKLADIAENLKTTYLNQLPKTSQHIIKGLDKTFAPVITRGNAILKNIVDKGGRIKTEWLSARFKNPASAGSREFLREMSDYGIDLSKSINLFASFAKRQGQKGLAGYIGRRSVPWIVGGSVLGRHMGGGE